MTSGQVGEQHRWDDYGKTRLAELAADPERFRITAPDCSTGHGDEVVRLLSPLPRRTILELGCGLGAFSVYLATQGAVVTGVDLGEQLVEASRGLAQVNEVDCEFVPASITDLPFADGTFDLVVGIAVLHHLPEDDVAQTLRETYRVLTPTGKALFDEPVENSRVFDFIQNLVPVSETVPGNSRPSILQRRAWAEWVARQDQRSMTDRELRRVGAPFRSVTLRHRGILIRLKRILGQRADKPLGAIDAFLLRAFPPIGHLARGVIAEYEK